MKMILTAEDLAHLRREYPQEEIDNDKLSEFVDKIAKQNPIFYRLCVFYMQTGEREFHQNLATNYPYLLETIPEENRNFDRLLEAVRNGLEVVRNGLEVVRKDQIVILDVPEEIDNDKLSEFADKIEKQNLIFYLLCIFYMQTRCREFHQNRVTNYPYLLETIPEEYRTFDLCLEAVRKSPFVIHDVPEEHRALISLILI